MLFIETKIFTDDVVQLLTDDDYREFQTFLAIQPEFGQVIPNTGGLRKIRWSSYGKGKRSGVRVIYYYKLSDSQIRLLLIYRKGIKDNLTEQEKKILRDLNERW
ncbi:MULTISPECIES: type II toxin-antitoxin system RelE/ParE family toxin [Xenorhabdus]|uniref:Type II toxin-antitoxin system RelE/ParE family toxin n=1 Tax=Xenorhabdus griffiniae TaxID=351672 RepID=A0ABY9XJC5_9GAMM|nr:MULTISPECIES: type II toxin-antitoxin system RelE/ParE family toxin [Xenorhabdus]MBD1226848.1 type II toxin-antitoxin system RelE/ParE family toxin [Xenorhabdus griffiniae]MBE8586211.1 type II toxin-antitoxin system RelE/ParE family toxin [Xenorhabdus griffiniae]MBE8596226.1 type II toxin-antitoxin system RelE/ParE family toxin [Xenorhabdus sp. BG5]WMV73035.1 type II toxin-antitoxin system RelE/ParE family toxin [Xenorhabdus griffiniae]WNH02714.1 type II toxin-antitoxin system RelE/ParE fam